MNQIDKMIGNIIGKPRVRGGKNDWDGDGVLNRKDCQPRNTMRQDPFATDKIIPNKRYGEHILIQDKTGKKYSTKNIGYIGARTLFDGEAIHGKEKKPDLIVDYEI